MKETQTLFVSESKQQDTFYIFKKRKNLRNIKTGENTHINIYLLESITIDMQIKRIIFLIANLIRGLIQQKCIQHLLNEQ